MKTGEIDILIRQIENRTGEYIGYCRAELLSASYFVYFQDSILGSVAINTFSEMIRFHYEKRINFIIETDRRICFQDRALLDVISGKRNGWGRNLY